MAFSFVILFLINYISEVIFKSEVVITFKIVLIFDQVLVVMSVLGIDGGLVMASAGLGID